MCDTIIATAEFAKDGVAIFGKNSNHAPNEAHHLVRHPAADFTPDSRVHCAHIEIPQAKHTFAVVLAKPFWSDASLPDLGPVPVSTYDPVTLFWRHEIPHRSASHGHKNLVATSAAQTKNSAAHAAVSAECLCTPTRPKPYSWSACQTHSRRRID